MPEVHERTIARNGTHELEIKKSRFLCSLVRTASEEEARLAIDATRKRYWDANHTCTAWRIGPEGRLQRSSDDGEPAGTAGIPMLEVLRHRGLTDVLAMVTRYFGGTKLGAGGLIRAYGTAVSEAIAVAGIVERRPLLIESFTVSHAESGRIEHALRASVFPLRDVAYNASDVEFIVSLEPAAVTSFASFLAELTMGQAALIDRGTETVEVLVSGD
jgi:uncharacterized YigZ family protein